jgi:hypothetical protein
MTKRQDDSKIVWGVKIYWLRFGFIDYVKLTGE